MLKMEGFLSATEGNCTTANRVAPGVELGRGSFGIVYQAKDAPNVVVKVFQDAAQRSSRAAWVRQELAAATAIPFHENIVRPFDVALDARNCLEPQVQRRKAVTAVRSKVDNLAGRR